MSKLEFQGKTITLDFNPGTKYRLTQSGYGWPSAFLDDKTQLPASIELLRICSKTKLTSIEVADALDDDQPLTKAVFDLFEEEEARIKAQPKEGDLEGNG